ncbi:protein ALP1-like [Miscanthus floridulus]|uniref:protein ALP1-like n=1 Tax=Miscanthus floridulus TaxID=154761 RepID=UPI003457A15A
MDQWAEEEEEEEEEEAAAAKRRKNLIFSAAELIGDIIRPLDPEFRTPHPRVRNPMFAPFFDNCIGAIDGTHIEVVVPKTELITHMNRKSKTSQNVLAICDFDLRFTFIVAGWPGSVHDMRVFKAAVDKFGSLFPHPPQGKFYVVDSGFSNQPGYLAPYKGTKYHFQEYNQGPPPRGSFNLRERARERKEGRWG